MLAMRDAARVAGEETRRAIVVQPDWLRAVPTDRRLPEGRILHTGCGTSFHAAQTGGWAVQALELVSRRSRPTCSSPSVTKATRR